MVDIRQTQEYANYLLKIGWIVERIGEVNYFIKKFPLIGSVIKIQRPQQFNNSTIKQLINKYRAFQIIVEPKDKNQELRIMNYGYKLSKSPYLPTKTLHLDLNKSEKELLSGMKKDARYALLPLKNLRTKELKNIKEIENFRNSWKKAVGWKRYVPPISHLIALKESFGINALFIAAGLPRQSEMAAGAIFLIGDKSAFYWQAFTNSEGRKLQAQYKIVWEGIKWAKGHGAKIFDFEGIYDERFPNKSWLGFTHFKKSFGGYEVSYLGAFVKNRLPL